MKKILYSLFMLIVVLCGCDSQSTQNQTQQSSLADDKIYFFYYNECPYCHDAMDYTNQKYPNLKMTMVNIHNVGGYRLLVECAKKYKLGNNVGTPLFAMGDKYIMGWSEETSKQFDEYIKPYLK